MTSASGLVGLTKINLREQALASLRTAITSGELPPQTRIVETELSERLQISRGTLYRKIVEYALEPEATPAGRRRQQNRSS